MKYILLLMGVCYSQVLSAAAEDNVLKKRGFVPATQHDLLKFFPDGITPGAVFRSASASTADTELAEGNEKAEEVVADAPASSSSAVCPPTRALVPVPAAATLFLEHRAMRRLLMRKHRRSMDSYVRSLSAAAPTRRQRRKRFLRPQLESPYKHTVAPIARTWADVSDAEKDRLGLFVREEPLSRDEERKQRYPVPPMPDAGITFPVDLGHPAEECFGAYLAYYSANPREPSRILVEWPPRPELDGKEPGWYWGVTNTGRPFLYFGGEDVFKAAMRAIRSRPRAGDFSSIFK